MRKLKYTDPEIQSEIESDTDTDNSKPTDDEIATLAYQLWSDRGCPIGSPDEDWLLAEKKLMKPQRVSRAAA